MTYWSVSIEWLVKMNQYYLLKLPWTEKLNDATHMTCQHHIKIVMYYWCSFWPSIEILNKNYLLYMFTSEVFFSYLVHTSIILLQTGRHVTKTYYNCNLRQWYLVDHCVSLTLDVQICEDCSDSECLGCLILYVLKPNSK